MPNVCNVHQRMDKMSHTSAYVGAIRCGVSTPLEVNLQKSLKCNGIKLLADAHGFNIVAQYR